MLTQTSKRTTGFVKESKKSTKEDVEELPLNRIESCKNEKNRTENEPPCATKLVKLNANQLTYLPTNNLDTEHDFSKFCKLSEIARFHNKKFSAKGI